ncbi:MULTISPECIES: DUF1456 family protein [unclassified Lentimicrobium]|uniref:DUF1456 family protein n=1 Tax=unclassified Lentimicrobium TaxID=2677434 RepID=UPI001557C840|nr:MULTISPECIES: DUF1456 family protein [unclassified Lentimicrobium]NPD44106.1 DUF1456 family protein [Lentimicrobium sp. S6]NPD86663.1 DUF1456 family protein [Lentimicrobium sp. L6]
MTKNDILRRIRYLFNYSDAKMVDIFKQADYQVEEADVIDWLRKTEDPFLIEISDKELAIFLNGLIVEKRGKREGPAPDPEKHLNNNIILRKLKIALDLKAEDIITLFASIDIKVGKPELSAFFRKPNHKSYRPVLDQYLRNFLNALQKKSVDQK